MKPSDEAMCSMEVLNRLGGLSAKARAAEVVENSDGKLRIGSVVFHLNLAMELGLVLSERVRATSTTKATRLYFLTKDGQDYVTKNQAQPH